MSYPLFLAALRTLDKEWTDEYRFHSTRRWRFDFALVSQRFAIEIDGGIWTRGRHSRGAGQVKDMEKGNAATLGMWSVLHFTPEQVTSGYAFRVVQMLHQRTLNRGDK